MAFWNRSGLRSRAGGVQPEAFLRSSSRSNSLVSNSLMCSSYSWSCLSRILRNRVPRPLRAAALLPLLAAGLAAQTEPGPAVGAKVPDFSVPDSTGKRQNFESLKGPKGLLLLFFRSADW